MSVSEWAAWGGLGLGVINASRDILRYRREQRSKYVADVRPIVHALMSSIQQIETNPNWQWDTFLPHEVAVFNSIIENGEALAMNYHRVKQDSVQADMREVFELSIQLHDCMQMARDASSSIYSTDQRTGLDPRKVHPDGAVTVASQKCNAVLANLSNATCKLNARL